MRTWEVIAHNDEVYPKSCHRGHSATGAESLGFGVGVLMVVKSTRWNVPLPEALETAVFHKIRRSAALRRSVDSNF